jgi:NAD(P)H-dependent FMN reductase
MNPPTIQHSALLLVGSPKGLKSSSHAIGSYLLKRLETAGLTTKTLVIGAALHTEADAAGMHEDIAAADIIIVSFPLYVDQLPAPLVKALELIAERRKSQVPARPQKIMAIVQCGFPETFQNQAACDIMRRFAKEVGFEWAGALAMGMGGAVGGRSLAKAGGMVRNIVRALDVTAAALINGENVPGEAAGLMAKPVVPKWMYLLMANWGMKREIKKRGVGRQTYARPYEP